MPHLRITMTMLENENCRTRNYSTYSASASPEFGQEIAASIVEVLRSFYNPIASIASDRHRSSKCVTFEFDDLIQRNTSPRIDFLKQLSKDDFNIALVDKMESSGWSWMGPNEICHNMTAQEATTTWTFRRHIS
ncbi:unnamed protein product [Clavelina lepadiformis]|uniref:Uncharacterized protein n=1 Tax=Clavelina lepadiformis TaxID=159417 RepID=A0ABP0FXZ0_CLALP